MDFYLRFDYWLLVLCQNLFYLLYSISGFLNFNWKLKFKNYLGYGLIVYTIFIFYEYS